MRIGIVGCGHVGTAMKKRFPDAVIYDEPKQIGTKDEINRRICTFMGTMQNYRYPFYSSNWLYFVYGFKIR